MPSASPAGSAPAAAGFLPSPASRSAALAPKSAAPQRRPAATGPGLKASPIAAAIRSSAAAPTAPATGAGGGNGATQGCAHLAVAAGLKTTAPSASHAARQGAHSTADAMLPGVPPAAACAAARRRSGACRAAADASRWRRSASLPSGKAPSARDDMPPAAQEASVWTAKRLRVVWPAVRAAHIGPTPARPSSTSFRCGRRRSQ